MRMRAYAIVAFVLAALVTLAPLRPAWSHAEMVKSSPANGAKLTKPPAEVRAWFNDTLSSNSIMRLYNASKAVVAVGRLDPKIKNHDQMRISTPHLKPGTYQVQWAAVSADDGAVSKGSFKFSVVGAALLPSSGSTSPLAGLVPAAPTRTEALLP